MLRIIALATVFCLALSGVAIAADSQVIHQDGKPYRHPASVTERVSVSGSAVEGATWLPYPGQFSVSLLLTSAPTCALQRQIDHYTPRIGTISGGTNVVLTTGTTEYLQTGMYVSGEGIPPGTTMTYVDSTHLTLSQAATDDSGIHMTFWLTQDLFTATQAGLLISWPLGVPWRMLFSGSGTARVSWVQ